LCFNLRLNFGKGDGTEVVVVHAHVVLQREEHIEARVIQTGVRGWAAMDVAEELPDIPVGAAVAEEGVVVEDDGLSAHADGHLLGDEFEAAHEALTDALHVMVAQDEVLAAGEGAEDVVPEPGAAEREIPQVEHDAVFRHRIPPAADELRIHFLHIAERSVAEANDILVPEMRVRREPDLLRGEGWDLGRHIHFLL